MLQKQERQEKENLKWPCTSSPSDAFQIFQTQKCIHLCLLFDWFLPLWKVFPPTGSGAFTFRTHSIPQRTGKPSRVQMREQAPKKRQLLQQDPKQKVNPVWLQLCVLFWADRTHRHKAQSHFHSHTVVSYHLISSARLGKQ